MISTYKNNSGFQSLVNRKHKEKKVSQDLEHCENTIYPTILFNKIAFSHNTSGNRRNLHIDLKDKFRRVYSSGNWQARNRIK